MREIKFRGRTKSGKYVYGDLIHKGDVVMIRTNKSYRYYEVDSESVSQFLGVDSKGNAVYENDTLTDEADNEFEASWLCFKVDKFVLKEK